MQTVLDELSTPELPEVMTTVNSPISCTLVEALHKSFLKPSSPYVFDCSTKSEADWEKLYPPIAAECKQLPGQGIPFWVYEFNYCTSCRTLLSLCENNPYGNKGAIGKARLARIQSTPVVTVSEVTEVVEIDEDGNERIVTKPSSSRAPRGSYAQKISKELMPIIRSEYVDNFATLADLSTKHMIAQSVIREFLAGENILRGRGSHMKNFGPTTKEGEPIQRRGRERSTIMVTPELVEKVKKMLAKGEGGGMVAIAKVENVNPAELSAALKAAGVVITKGRKASK